MSNSPECFDDGYSQIPLPNPNQMLVSALFCVILDKGCNPQAGDIPVRDLSQEVVDIMQSYFRRKNVQTLADFAFSLIKALLSDIPESNPSKTPKKAKVDPPRNLRKSTFLSVLCLTWVSSVTSAWQQLKFSFQILIVAMYSSAVSTQ